MTRNPLPRAGAPIAAVTPALAIARSGVGMVNDEYVLPKSHLSTTFASGTELVAPELGKDVVHKLLSIIHGRPESTHL